MNQNTGEFINYDFEEIILEFTAACVKDDFETSSNSTFTTSHQNQPVVSVPASVSNISNNQNTNQNLPTTSQRLSSQTSHSIQTVNNTYIAKEAKDLNEEILILKGQHKITERKFKSQLNSRDEEIKLLKEQLFQIQTESANSIKSLTSQLKFQEASLHGANQQSMHLKAINDSINESTEAGKLTNIKVISASPVRKRKQIEFESDFTIKSQQPKKCKTLSFKNLDNSFLQFSEIDAEKQSTESLNIPKKMLPSTSEKVMIPKVKSESQTVSNIKENKFCICDTSSKENLKPESSDIYQIFNYTLDISDENDAWNLIGLSEFKSTLDCCVPINYDNMFGFIVKAMQKFIPLFKSCINTNYPEIIDEENMKELLKLVSLQFQRLCISMCKRKGSVDNMLDDIMGRKIFNKLELLINPQYSCLYHYIYPASEVIKKMMHIAHYHSNYVGEFVMECLLPTLVKIINYFVIDFCCIPHSKNNITFHCRTYMDGVENMFLKNMLIALIQMITLSSGSLKDCILQKICKYFNKLVPLFASKLNLKIVTIKLFCEMINYPMFLDMLSQHNAQDTCLINIIMDILNCKCIQEKSQIELIEFSNNVAQIFFTLHLADFKWDASCSCSNEMILLINNISVNISKHISETQWTEDNKKCIQNILIVYSQLKISFRASAYYEFTKISNPYEFFVHLDYLVDSQHPLLIEDTWPLEYSWFNQLMTDTKFFYKK